MSVCATPGERRCPPCSRLPLSIHICSALFGPVLQVNGLHLVELRAKCSLQLPTSLITQEAMPHCVQPNIGDGQHVESEGLAQEQHLTGQRGVEQRRII